MIRKIIDFFTFPAEGGLVYQTEAEWSRHQRWSA